VGVRQLIVQGYLSPLHSLMTKPLSKEVSMQTAVQHPNIPTRFVLGSDGRHDVLCCPVCACPYVHPAEVAVEQGRTRTVVTEEATDVLATDRFLRARGSLITLDFWCEFGHAFQYSLEFHKGHMHLKLATEPLDVSQPLD
jgi:hypothetical protein